MEAANRATLWQLLEAAPAEGSALILSDSGARISYGALRRNVRAVADSLASKGIRPGDRVAMALPNGPAALVCFLGAAIAGTAAPLNPTYRREEFKFYLEDTDAKLLIVPAEGAGEAIAATEGKVPLITVETDASGEVRFPGASHSANAAEPRPEQVALVLHTSGTTGTPKRVPLTHRNLSVSAGNIVNTYRLGAEDVSLCVMPLFHVHGLVASVLATLATAGTVVLPGKFNPFTFWRVVGDYRVTWYSAVPTIHQVLLGRSKEGGRPPGADTLRFIRSCSAPLSAEQTALIEKAFGVAVLQAYGMTEASHQMASNPLPPAVRKAGTVGPGTGVEIAIVDAEDRFVGSDKPGEVVIRGPGVMGGYENNPEANARSFIQGWFRTGDEGVLDSDGYLRLVGRLKEMINRGGEKVSPVEVDEVLLSHPMVSDAVSFGVEHPTWGEEVAAAVVLREPLAEAALLAFCRERLADYKRPKKIYILDALPRTTTGKIQRRAVAAALKPAKV